MLIASNEKVKFYKTDGGNYSVHVLKTHNFDGIIDQCWDVESFEDDGMHCGGGWCSHNFPIKYSSGDKRTNAIAYAREYGLKIDERSVS